jgi:hypothetical protein
MLEPFDALLDPLESALHPIAAVSRLGAPLLDQEVGHQDETKMCRDSDCRFSG